MERTGLDPICKALNVRCYGSGPETIVLAHGFGGAQSDWERYLPLLSGYRVVLYDLAGSSGADPAYFDYLRHGALDGHAEDLLTVLRRSAPQPCTFVGHSVSGMIGILAAIAASERFHQLILVGSSARYLDDDGYRGGFDAATVEAILSAIKHNFSAWAASTAPVMAGRPPEDPAAQTFLASLLRMEPDKTVAMAKAIFLSDYRSILANCRVPAVILQTRQDPAVTPEAAHFLKDHLRHSSLEILDATGHLPHISAPETFVAALARYLPQGIDTTTDSAASR